MYNAWNSILINITYWQRFVWRVSLKKSFGRIGRFAFEGHLMPIKFGWDGVNILKLLPLMAYILFEKSHCLFPNNVIPWKLFNISPSNIHISTSTYRLLSSLPYNSLIPSTQESCFRKYVKRPKPQTPQSIYVWPLFLHTLRLPHDVTHRTFNIATACYVAFNIYNEVSHFTVPRIPQPYTLPHHFPIVILRFRYENAFKESSLGWRFRS